MKRLVMSFGFAFLLAAGASLLSTERLPAEAAVLSCSNTECEGVSHCRPFVGISCSFDVALENCTNSSCS